MAQNQIGLETTDTKGLAEKLNALLANYQVFYMNARGFPMVLYFSPAP